MLPLHRIPLRSLPLPRTAVLAFALIIPLLAAAGCHSHRTTQDFILDSPQAIVATPAENKKHLLIEEFTAATEYSRQSFVYRTSPHRIHYDPNRRWAIPPEDMIREQVARQLLATGLFARVATRLDMPPPDLILRGNLLRLGERVDKGSRYAELSLHLELLDAKSQTLLWSALKTREKPVENQNFESVIAVLSLSLQEILKESIPEMQARWSAP